MYYNNGQGNVTINFNICDYTIRNCPDGYADYANEVNQNNTCVHLSSASISDIGVSLIDPDEPDLGLVLTFKGGNQCNATSDYQLVLQLNCDEYASTTTYNLDPASIATPCTPRVIMNSPVACPVLSLGTLWTFFNDYYYIFGVSMILIGILLMVFGGRFFKVTLFLVGQVSVAAFILIIMFALVYPTDSPMWVVWLTLVVSFGIGAGIGYATQRWARFGVLLLGLWIGGLLGAIMYCMFLHVFNNGGNTGLWVILGIFGAVCAVLSMIYFDHAVIYGSAMGGAYTFVRVSSHWII